jgi:hypothetical protein
MGPCSQMKHCKKANPPAASVPTLCAPNSTSWLLLSGWETCLETLGIDASDSSADLHIFAPFTSFSSTASNIP